MCKKQFEWIEHIGQFKLFNPSMASTFTTCKKQFEWIEHIGLFKLFNPCIASIFTSCKKQFEWIEHIDQCHSVQTIQLLHGFNLCHVKEII
jgi:hypothetical protein